MWTKKRTLYSQKSAFERENFSYEIQIEQNAKFIETMN